MCRSFPTLQIAALTLLAFAMPRGAWATLNYTAGATSFSVAPNATIDLPIYIAESGATHEISSDGGLFSAGFAVQQISPLPAQSVTIAGVTSNLSLFDTINAGSFYGDSSAALYVDQSGGTIATGALPTNGLLLVGTVTFQAPATGGLTSVFSITDFDGSSANVQTLTYGGTSLDSSIQAGTFSITTTPTPEPAAFISALSMGILTLRERSRFSACSSVARRSTPR